MYRDKILPAYRSLLLRVYVVIAIAVLAMELLIYFSPSILDSYQSFWEYFPDFVLIPTLINAALIFAVYKVHKNTKISERNKNAAMIVGLECIAFNISVVHCFWTVLPCCLCIPILLSPLFGDKRLVRQTTELGILFLILSIVQAYYYKPYDEWTIHNGAITLIIMIISALIGKLFIRFETELIEAAKEQTKYREKLEQMLQTDQMTGLYNQKAFFEKLDQAVSSVRKSHMALVLAVIDIDNFKSVNDTYGHDCGKEVIIKLAELMLDGLDVYDTAYRCGGEEFAIIFFGKSMSSATKACDRLLSRFRSTKFSFTERQMSFSCGLSLYSEELSPEAFFSNADQAMYQAKRGGKNRCFNGTK